MCRPRPPAVVLLAHVESDGLGPGADYDELDVILALTGSDAALLVGGRTVLGPLVSGFLIIVVF